MPRIRINVRRPESVRRQTRSVSAASTPTPTTATSASSAGNTIEVAQAHRPSDVPAAPVTDAPTGTVNGSTMGAPGGASEQRATRETPVEPSKIVGAQVVEAMLPPAEKEDVVMMDEDDNVMEYDFENEKESEEDDSEDPAIFSDAVHDVITISSDDDVPKEDFGIDPRPWLKLDRDGRAAREKMYCKKFDIPINGNWQTTESYQEMQDDEMDEYIKDFPLHSWVIGQAKALAGFERMVERRKLRACGVEVFRHQILDAMGYQPKTQQELQQQQQRPMPPQQLQHHQAQYPYGHQQMPMPQQYPPQHMAPPPHMVHHGGMPYPPGSAPMPPPPHVLSAYQPMQQVGVDRDGQPLYQPVHPQHHPQPPLAMGPPSRPASLPQVPQQVPQKRPSTGAADVAMQSSSQEKGRVPVLASSMNEERTLTSYRRRKKQKQETLEVALPAASSLPSDQSVVPPYTARSKPTSSAALTTKSGKSSKRKATDASEFPWNRNINFEAAKAKAFWTNGLYDTATLDAMEEVRRGNKGYITNVDCEENEKLRQAKLAKTSGAGDDVDDFDRPKRQKKEPKNADVVESSNATAADPSVSSFEYATDADQHKAMALVKSQAPVNLPTEPTVEQLMEAAEVGRIEVNLLRTINICWNPRKKGLTQALRQVKFSIADSLLTRQTLAMTAILNADAAMCVIDFCPDLLVHQMLLRITSESSLRNKDVRDRMCENGNWVDKSTFTRRISAALGQKQGKVDAADQLYYKQNVEDYHRYQTYFGNGSSSRKSRAGPSGLTRRDGVEVFNSSSPPGSRSISSGSDGSLAVGENGGGGVAVAGMTIRSLSGNKGKDKMREIVQLDGAAEEEEEESAEEDADGGVDVVSLQSDGELDRLAGSDSDD